MSERSAEWLLRAAVHDLAGKPHQTPDLAAVAVTRGRRIRRRRRAGAVAAALVAATAIAAPYVWLRPDPRSPGQPIVGPPAAAPTSAPSPGPISRNDWQRAPLLLPGGWVVVGATSTGTPAANWAYDRTRDRYVETAEHYTSVWTAPQGRLAAVRQSDRPGETGLLDVPTGEVQWIRTGNSIHTPQWSPDGSRLLITLMDKRTGNLSFGVLAAGDRSFRRYPVRSDRFVCTNLCQFTWVRDGREVALPVADPPAPAPPVRRAVQDGKEVALSVPSPAVSKAESKPYPQRGLLLFRAVDGAPTHFLPVRGNVSGPWAWSPDGQLVVVAGQRAAQLVSVAQGTVLRKLPAADVSWVDEDRLLYVDSTPGTGGPVDLTAVLIDRQGTDLERVALPGELAGSTILFAPR